jgi:hypothetical protein
MVWLDRFVTAVVTAFDRVVLPKDKSVVPRCSGVYVTINRKRTVAV